MHDIWARGRKVIVVEDDDDDVGVNDNTNIDMCLRFLRSQV